MLPLPVSKTCLYCNTPLKGRSDQKFCNDDCRSSFHNIRKMANRDPLVREINLVLRKNQGILKQLLGPDQDSIRVSREELLMKGFQFKYLTHSEVDHKGRSRSCCYDMAYTRVRNMYLVCRCS